MADRTRHESVTEEVTKRLAKWIEKECGSIRETYLDFPEANLKMKMPSVSVAAPSPNLTTEINPYTCKKSSTSKDHEVRAAYVIGEWNFNLQLDLWCGSKEELDDVFDELFNSLSPEISPIGLRLTLDDYHGVICNYVFTGHERQNSEISSQKDEWRITLNVLATCNAIRTKKQFIIDETQIQTIVSTDSSLCD